ncbi:MAG: glycosyltransferase family 2 protein [Candidatus Omnitrophica bacterium]|nr:glycosyltransferase family 2 protein [Candidatus Omnitrophota bacterium]
MNKNISVSVIIPAYNEAGHIRYGIEETVRTFKELSCAFKIIVVDDGSTDDTLELAKETAQKYDNIIVKQNRANHGKGRALKFGFRFAKGDYVVFLDADMDLHPAQISTFFDILELDKADIVIGSKRHPNSVIDYPLQRKIISSFYFFLVKLLFGLPIRDTQTGLKLFKHEVLAKVLPKILVRKFAYDLEILANAHRLGYKIKEAPVVLESQRPLGRIGISAIYVTWIDTLAIWYRMYILKYYDRIDNHNL